MKKWLLPVVIVLVLVVGYFLLSSDSNKPSGKEVINGITYNGCPDFLKVDKAIILSSTSTAQIVTKNGEIISSNTFCLGRSGEGYNINYKSCGAFYREDDVIDSDGFVIKKGDGFSFFFVYDERTCEEGYDYYIGENPSEGQQCDIVEIDCSGRRY